MPWKAFCVTATLEFLLSILTLVSVQLIIALSVMASLTTYGVSIACVARKRICGEELPLSNFNLGKFVLPINIVATLVSLFLGIFAFFPTKPNPAATDINWAVVVLGAFVVGSILYYMLGGQRTYQEPVATTVGR